jgi:hypothetical protein
LPARTTVRYCGDKTGASSTAKAFGADVSFEMEGQSLFFLVGRGEPPDSIVQRAGGVVVTRLPDPRRVLAVLPLSTFGELQRHPGLELAGPVAIDPERFGRFAQLIRLDDARPP